MASVLIQKKNKKQPPGTRPLGPDDDIPRLSTEPPKNNHSIREFLVKKPPAPNVVKSTSTETIRPSPSKRHKPSAKKSAPPNGIAPSKPTSSQDGAKASESQGLPSDSSATASAANADHKRSASIESTRASQSLTDNSSDDDDDDDDEASNGVMDEEAAELRKAVKSTQISTSNPMHFSVMVHQQLMNMRYSGIRGKSTIAHFVRYFNVNQIFPRRYHRINISNSMTNARKTCLEEQAWLAMASAYDVMSFDMNLKWPMFVGQRPQEQLFVKDYVLTFDSISSWLNPRTFWKMSMPKAVMEMLEWRTAHQFLQYKGADDEKSKKRGNAVETSEQAKSGDVNYGILTLACDAFWWHRRKRIMTKKWPIAPRDKYPGYDTETSRLEMYLNDQMKGRVEGTVEQRGRRMILESNLPLGATDRFCRMNPQVMDYYTPDDIFVTSLDEKDYVAADDQRACKIHISTTDRNARLTLRAKYIAEWDEAKKEYLKHNRELIAKAKKDGLPFHFPDSFKSKDGMIVGQKDIDRLAVEMTPETRDIWQLVMFDSWWKRETTQNFCETHCVMWADWDHPEEVRSALKRLCLEFEEDGKTPRRPLIVCLGFGLWYVHYKGMFLIPDEATVDPLKRASSSSSKSKSNAAPTKTRALIACLALWMSITKDEFKNKLGPGLVAPEKPIFWQPTQEEKNAADKEMAKTFKYVSPADAVAAFLSKKAK